MAATSLSICSWVLAEAGFMESHSTGQTTHECARKPRHPSNVITTRKQLATSFHALAAYLEQPLERHVLHRLNNENTLLGRVPGSHQFCR